MNVNITELFPIKTEPACKLKWTSSTIWLFDNKTSSCHRCTPHQMNIINKQLEFHNTLDKIQQRNTMLSGKWPDGIGCEYCKYIELSNGISDRQFQNSIPGYCKELDNNINEVNVIPTTIEVYLDNKCNMSCVYCVPRNSSRIQQEIDKFGAIDLGFDSHYLEGYNGVFPVAKKNIHYKNVKNKFWEWMHNNYQNLLRFQILGGEPLYQKEFVTCIDFLEQHINVNLEFNVISNIILPHKKFCMYIDYRKEKSTKQKSKLNGPTLDN